MSQNTFFVSDSNSEKRSKPEFNYYKNVYTGRCLPIFAFVVFLIIISGTIFLLGLEAFYPSTSQEDDRKG